MAVAGAPTATLEEEVARWARIRAAEHDTSVSRFVGELLRDRMVEERTYEATMRDYLAQPPRKLRQTGSHVHSGIGFVGSTRVTVPSPH